MSDARREMMRDEMVTTIGRLITERERLREHAEQLYEKLLDIMMQPGEPDVMGLGYIETSLPRALLAAARDALDAYRKDYPKEATDGK